MFKKVLLHSIAVVAFAVVAMLYCQPATRGKVLQQSDVMYWRAMAQQSFEYKETHGHFPLWTNSMFCGMPAYFIAMDADNPVSLTNVHSAYMSIFPKPVCFFFLLCLSMYVLCLVFNINPYIAVIGSIDYAYRWSYGIMETFTMLVPNIFGGKSSVDLTDDSRFIQYFKNNKINKEIPVDELKKDWPQYWGNQPSVAGPVYAGAVICFLFLLSLFIIKGLDKYVERTIQPAL
jgi:hypothetical protein